MLDDRKIKILRAIVVDYIATAEPVGSRTIARKYHMGISPATIRNEMADLEELGYIAQPYTSAGRIPSDKGYRFYVDFLMPVVNLSENEINAIHQIFKKRIKELEDLIEETSRVISNLTNYTTVILGPQLHDSRLKHVEILRLEKGKGLLIMVTNYGTIVHQIIELPQNLKDSDLTRISNLFNKYLVEKTVEEITPDYMNRIKNEMREYEEALKSFIQVLIERLQEVKESGKVFSSGSSRMLDFPEFKDVEKARNFLSLIEEEDFIIRVLKSTSKPNRITISIGNENPWKELQEFSIITTNFKVGGKSLGIFGVIGPTRMDYSKVVSILNKVEDYLNETLSTLI
ncbi:heat-inducible transcriptional repressor HrcA [Thermosediminibacter oceani]|uniref:Heat-inducible transcription repressor HrcA n=1 Tax=Thermosediminibacter oceani (strain ATCC BAA-1034 / DSM 16646 / JW/IW-1228P) TaxID=555079 RepID=D9S2P1_THEOJ|nr:heat-inducible transcriptional repressor HrcA [Thermosediminibacter oceani]ADL07668.1 heat-inducible transcription repressor HrcA [Thermosediminibacter oceani DSM 16646]